MALAPRQIMIDTSAYSAFNRGDVRLKPYIVPNVSLLLPLIVVGELRAGFASGSRWQENEKLLRRFMDMPNVSMVTLKDQTTELFASLYAELRAAGTPMGTNDIWIAALAVEHEAELLTLDADFCRVPGLKRIEIG